MNINKEHKSELTPYEEWPDLYAKPDDMVQIQVTAPDKLTYKVGEDLDVTGGYLTVHYYDGSTKEISLSDASVKIDEPDESNNYDTNFLASDMREVGFKFLRVVYEGFADNFTILVVDEAAEDGTAGDASTYPVELTIDQEEIVDGATINVENAVSTYTISGTLLGKGGDAVVKINGVNSENITVTGNTFYGQESDADDSDNHDSGKNADDDADDAESDEKTTTVATSDSTKTGDTTNVWIWMFMVIVTAGAALGLTYFRKYRTR